MKLRMPSWPALFIWAAFAIAVYVIGAGFAGSWVPEVPPPLDYPVSFILWLATLVIILAPFVLIALRLLRVRKADDA